MESRKAVSPVVAVALLLVTTVIAAVGFQTWFNEFSTELFTDTETKGDGDGLASRVETITDGNLYVYSGFTNNISYSNLQVAGKTCNISGQLANGVNTIDITSCSAISSGVNEVVVITEKGIISEEVYVSSSGTSSLSITCTNASDPFHGGAGTAGDPYEICNCSQLEDMQTSLASYYELVQDVDCNVAPLNTGNGFTAISGPFTGDLEGNNYVVSGLYINLTSSRQGLFGRLRGNVSNMGLTNVNITASDQVGAFLGYSNQDAILDNVYATGTISGSRLVGGLAGYGRQAIINNSYSTVTITATGDVVGGLAGEVDTAPSYIQNSYYSGTITATADRRVGGIAGRTSSALVHNTYSTGTINGGNHTGGLIGAVNGGEINDSYSTATVDGITYVGGLIGYTAGTTVENSYASGSVNGSSDVGGFAGRFGSSFMNSSFSTGDVTGSSNTGGFVGANAGGTTFVTVYWNNHSGNPSWVGGGSGINAIQDDLSHFYGSSNAPHGNWSSTDWSFSGSALPTLN